MTVAFRTGGDVIPLAYRRRGPGHWFEPGGYASPGARRVPFRQWRWACVGAAAEGRWVHRGLPPSSDAPVDDLPTLLLAPGTPFAGALAGRPWVLYVVHRVAYGPQALCVPPTLLGRAARKEFAKIHARRPPP